MPKKDLHVPLEKGKEERSLVQIGNMREGERELAEREGEHRRGDVDKKVQKN